MVGELTKKAWLHEFHEVFALSTWNAEAFRAAFPALYLFFRPVRRRSTSKCLATTRLALQSMLFEMRSSWRSTSARLQM